MKVAKNDQGLDPRALPSCKAWHRNNELIENFISTHFVPKMSALMLYHKANTMLNCDDGRFEFNYLWLLKWLSAPF